MAPAPLAVEWSWTTDLYPCPPPVREHWHHNSNTHLHAQHCGTHPLSAPHPPTQWTATNGLFSRRPLPFRTPLSLSPPPWRLPGSRERLHTHIHPTMPLRVFRMSLFTSWSVQVAAKQTQSLPGSVCVSPVLTSIHVVSMQTFTPAPQFACT